MSILLASITSCGSPICLTNPLYGYNGRYFVRSDLPVTRFRAIQLRSSYIHTDRFQKPHQGPNTFSPEGFITILHQVSRLGTRRIQPAGSVSLCRVAFATLS